MICKEHPDYQAKRRPRVSCFSCWRLYLDTKGVTVESAIAEAKKADNAELVYWLRESIDDIIYAPLEEEAKSAKISNFFEFLPEILPPEEDKNDHKPAKGVII